jgi:hypothetical protein
MTIRGVAARREEESRAVDQRGPDAPVKRESRTGTQTIVPEVGGAPGTVPE